MRHFTRCVVVGVVVIGLAWAAGSAHAQFLGQDSVTGTAKGATATGAQSTALGDTSNASGDYSTALGESSKASGADSTALGVYSTASGTDSTAIGMLSTASGTESTAIGQGSIASGDYSTATGMSSHASGAQSTALGAYSAAEGDSSTALGLYSRALGAQSTALGESSLASGAQSTALGTGSTASGNYSTALGQDSTAGFANSTAIGYGATTTRNNQVMLGTANNTYTAPGITSDASRAAQSGTTQVVTSDAGGNLATTDTNSIVAGSSAFQGLENRVDQNSEGVAMALAMAGGAAILPDGKNSAISANWGTFAGQNAIAMSGVRRLTQNTYLNGGVGAGTGKSTVGGRAGVTVAW